MHRGTVLFLVAGILLGGCRSHPSGDSASPPPHYEGLGPHRRTVSTSSPEAQRYFDQGLVFAYAFNHDEAIRSFTAAAQADPECAMCWWGIALCHGPHINNPVVPPERERAAWAAVQKALSLKDRATPVERALIEALAKRYASQPPADRKPLDEAYAAAMREVWLAHPQDPDVGVLFAEAMMDLRPWNLWTQEGRPQPGTEEILAALDSVQRLEPDHPGALHLFIHAVEASPEPEKGIPAADRLRLLVPVSGHLLHMPSHIDVLTGRWTEAAESNVRAMDADRRYRQIAPRQGFYNIYMAHDQHMLAFVGMMDGKSQMALDAAREIFRSVPEDYALSQPAAVDPFFAILYDALVRFGRWDEILREPPPPAHLPFTTAMWRLSRGLAYAAKGDVPAAERARAEFQQSVKDLPAGRMLAINDADHVLRIGTHVLDGEITYRRGDIERAASELRKAIALEDELKYMEPPEWPIPVRHTLGAILLSAGRAAEAEAAYREDLERWPGNGWSLYGLSQCLEQRGATAEAAEARRAFEEAWADADMKIGSSCLCVPGN